MPCCKDDNTVAGSKRLQSKVQARPSPVNAARPQWPGGCRCKTRTYSVRKITRREATMPGKPTKKHHACGAHSWRCSLGRQSPSSRMNHLLKQVVSYTGQATFECMQGQGVCTAAHAHCGDSMQAYPVNLRMAYRPTAGSRLCSQQACIQASDATTSMAVRCPQTRPKACWPPCTVYETCTAHSRNAWQL